MRYISIASHDGRLLGLTDTGQLYRIERPRVETEPQELANGISTSELEATRRELKHEREMRHKMAVTLQRQYEVHEAALAVLRQQFERSQTFVQTLLESNARG